MQSIKTDIVVAGGGVAGCAAAIAAAREGHKVTLVEKLTICGGLSTAGNVIYYLPLCDGYGKQVIHGLGEEFLHATLKYGPGRIGDWQHPRCFHDRYAVLGFNPASFVLALDELLVEAGVDVWFDTVLTKAVTDEESLVAVEVYNKSGLLRLEAQCFIDSTGDADLAVSAGCPFHTGKSWMSGWTLEMSPENPPTRLRVNQGVRKDELVEGINGKTVSCYTLRSREILRESYLERWTLKDLSPENTYPVTLPTQQNLRKTRAIDGRRIINDQNPWTDFPDSVGIFQASHDAEASMMWSIPFGVLLPKRLDNLLVAGRCISSDGWCWDNTRLIPMAAQTGNIAGVAAALSLTTGMTPQSIHVDLVQKRLSEQGHLLNFREAYGEDWDSIARERAATRQS